MNHPSGLLPTIRLNPRRLLFVIRTILPVIAIAMLASCATLRRQPAAPATEARGVWLSRFDYCTVPDFDQDLIRAYIANTIQAAAEANINMVFFQVRGSGDAYYASDLEPWGPLLTGNLGGDPGWDPLEYAIDEAHANGLELHA
ncbi:MAG: family 10 glycosylhydrolase, partial [Candidatus Marinimicrobia bacterium]|nr:family 10 glycosylhydrolase [Candidatus Neomarinimicrobiota bacterium]